MSMHSKKNNSHNRIHHAYTHQKQAFILIFMNILLLSLLCISIYLVIGILHSSSVRSIHESQIIQKGGDE